MGTRKFFLICYTYDPKLYGDRGFPLQIVRLHMDPEFLGNPEYLFSKGPYSASLGETTTGTCLDFAFSRLIPLKLPKRMIYTLSNKRLSCST